MDFPADRSHNLSAMCFQGAGIGCSSHATTQSVVRPNDYLLYFVFLPIIRRTLLPK
jgi:hypothetical protein